MSERRPTTHGSDGIETEVPRPRILMDRARPAPDGAGDAWQAERARLVGELERSRAETGRARRDGARAADGYARQRVTDGALSEAVTLSEARYRAILESATDYAIVATDLEGRVTTWNEGARRILGWSDAEILGQPSRLLFTPEDREAGVPDGEMATALAEGRAADERWHPRRDGSLVFATGMTMPLRVAGEVQGFLKIMRDRSAEREAEHRQRRTEERLQLALGASDLIGTWEWDLETGLVHADANFAGLYGIDPARAEAGAPLADFLDRHHPDDMPAVREALARTRTDRTPFAQEYRVVRPDGTVRWALARGNIVHEAGRPVRFPGAVVDITDNKRAELLQSALVSLGDTFQDIADPAGMAVAAAEIAGRALGLTRAGYGSIDASGEYLDVARDWRAGGVVSVAGRHRFADYGTFLEDLRRHEIVVVDDVAEDPRTRAGSGRMEAAGIRAMLNVPVIERGRLVAVLFLHDDKVRHWSPDRLAFVREVAQRTRDAVERRRAEDQRRLLMHELQHRVKNMLAMVQAIARQSFTGPESAAARDAFASRVMALGQANDVLTRSGWTAASLGDLVDGATSPHRFGPDRIAISGPPIEIAAGAALSFTLALHELCTNASKYGALSREGGRVEIAWSVEGGGLFRLRWAESGGPPVGTPTRRGFGTRLLERTLGAQFGGSVVSTYEPDGLVCVIEIPLASIGLGAAPEGPAAETRAAFDA